MSRERRILCLLMFLLTVTGPVRGQLNAENIKGDNGLKSGSQPPPCTYLTNLNYSYDAGEIKLPNRSVTLEGGLNLYLNTTAITRVTKKRFPGANYGMQFVVPTLNTALELPRARTNSANFGISGSLCRAAPSGLA